MQTSFFLKTHKKFTRIQFCDVLYIEAVKKYLTVVTSQQRYEIQSSLNHAEKILPCIYFCRINKSHIVSMQHIRCFDNSSVCVGEKKLPLGRMYKKQLMERLIILDHAVYVDPLVSDTILDQTLQHY